jgi:hypothetical protein
MLCFLSSWPVRCLLYRAGRVECPSVSGQISKFLNFSRPKIDTFLVMGFTIQILTNDSRVPGTPGTVLYIDNMM